MLAQLTTELIRKIRGDCLDAKDFQTLESLSVAQLCDEFFPQYPIRFLERSVGNKQEVGLAKHLDFKLTSSERPSAFPVPGLLPTLSQCLFLSFYDDSISELTLVDSISLGPIWDGGDRILVSMSPGRKVDRTPDGWVSKSLPKSEAVYDASFLVHRGWQPSALASVPVH